MSLTAAEVAEIVKLVEQSGFDELTLEIEGLKLSLRRNGAGHFGAATPLMPTGAVASPPTAAAPLGVPPERAAAPAPAPTVSAHAQAPGAKPASVNGPSAVAPDPDSHEVRSPLLGTFYRSPKPGAPPFVEEGTLVEPDTVVAIIEVMKLMNTVRAGVKGIVTDILVSDGVLVEFDQSLVRVRKSG